MKRQNRFIFIVIPPANPSFLLLMFAKQFIKQQWPYSAQNKTSEGNAIANEIKPDSFNSKDRI